MKLLLDTHVILWFAEDNPRLSASARAATENPANEIFYSAASIWEIAIKLSLGKLKLTHALDDSFREFLAKNGFDFLAVEFEHAARVSGLPLHHANPFDRLLIAQGIVEGLRPVSNDTAFDAYEVKRLW